MKIYSAKIKTTETLSLHRFITWRYDSNVSVSITKKPDQYIIVAVVPEQFNFYVELEKVRNRNYQLITDITTSYLNALGN